MLVVVLRQARYDLLLQRLLSLVRFKEPAIVVPIVVISAEHEDSVAQDHEVTLAVRITPDGGVHAVATLPVVKPPCGSCAGIEVNRKLGPATTRARQH